MCGVLLATFMSSAKSAWTRAVKPGQAADPFDDTAGLNVLVKLVGAVALVIAPFLAS